jgi:hypothetical protein
LTIPLASIRALTLGRYALTAKPVPLDYLEVTFLEGPDSRTLLFTPTLSGLSPVWETNRVVAEWATAVQASLQAATGRTIELNRSVAARGRFWNEVWETYGLTAALCTWPFLLMPILLEHRAPTQWKDWLLGPLVATAVLGSLLLVRWLMERRALQKGSLGEITALPIAYDKDDPVLLLKPEQLPVQPGQRPPLGGKAGRHPGSQGVQGGAADASSDPDIGIARPATQPWRPGDGGLSWNAVAALGCSLLAWWWALGLMFRLQASLGPDGLPPGGFSIGMMELVAGCAGLLGLSLGAQALREIRRSAGRRRGARVAIAALAALPAGALIKLGPPLVTAIARSYDWRPTATEGEMLMGATLIGIFILLTGVAWRLRRWVRPGNAPIRPHATWVWMGIASLLPVLADLRAASKTPISPRVANVPGAALVEPVQVAEAIEAVPGQTEGRFRSCTPGQRFLRLTFVRWTNGAPTVEPMPGPWPAWTAVRTDHGEFRAGGRGGQYPAAVEEMRGFKAP